MERIPILKMGRFLLVTIQVDMHVSRVLDAKTVVVGMRPAVAITLVELGMTLDGVSTALNVDTGMAMLNASLEEMEQLNGGSQG